MLGLIEKPRPLPNSIADDVLGKKKVVASALAVFGAVGLLALDSGSKVRAADASLDSAVDELVVRWPVWKIRPRPVAAWLQSLQGSLLGLPFHELRALP